MTPTENTKSRELRDKLLRWLLAEYSSAEPFSAENTLWAYKAPTGDGRILLMARLANHPDAIILQAIAQISHVHRERWFGLTEEQRRSFLLDLQLEYLRLGVNYASTPEFEKIEFTARLWIEDLTRNVFSRNATLVLSSLSLFMLKFALLMGEYSEPGSVN